MKLNIRVNWVFFCVQIHVEIGDFDRFKRYKLNDSMAHRLRKFLWEITIHRAKTKISNHRFKLHT